MAEVTEHYDNLAERAEKVALREGQGYRMLHDDFDPDWVSGIEPYGMMTFTDEPAPVALPPPMSELELRVNTLEGKVDKLEKAGMK